MRRALFRFSTLRALVIMLAAAPVAAKATKTAAPVAAPTTISPRAIVPAGPPPRILPLAEVRAGMVGEALTVFQGTKPAPFKIRVVAIMRNFLPKQDVILIRAEDPRLEHTGIVAGMSGSPVYIDGKLMGAIAYAWSFAKEPLGGVTPIEAMLAERKRPRRNPPGRDGSDGSAGGGDRDDGTIRTVTIAEGGPTAEGGLADAARADVPRFAAREPSAPGPTEARLRPVAIPLSVSGFDARTVAEMDRELRPMGLVPVQAGGGRRPGDGGPGHVEPGSAIGVELVRGDMSVVGTGTVTYVDGSTVLAFGHPMMGVGEIYLPLVDAEIHAILPSLSQSMKLSSPLREVGSLVQDRKACILGDLGARATMVPITVRVTGPSSAPRLFRAEVARNRRLTPMLAALVTSSAIADSEPDVTDMMIAVTSRVALKGHAPLDLRDQIFSSEGLSASVLSSLRGLRAVGELLFNPFEPVVLDRVDIDVRVEFRRDAAEIVGVSLPGDTVRAGDTVPLRVSLRPYAGPEYVEVVPFVVPRTVGRDLVRVEVASGVTVRPDLAPPESLAGVLDNLGKSYPPSSIVVSVQTLGDGAATRGRLLPDLPSAAFDTLRSSDRARRVDAYRVSDKTVFPTKHLVFGKQEVNVYVDEDVVGAARAGASR